MECGAFFAPSRSVRPRFLRARRLFLWKSSCPSPNVRPLFCAKGRVKNESPPLSPSAPPLLWKSSRPLAECAPAFLRERSNWAFAAPFFAACYAFSHFEADILHFAAKLSLLQQLTCPKAQNLTFISKTRPLKHRNVYELLLHKTPITAHFRVKITP